MLMQTTPNNFFEKDYQMKIFVKFTLLQYFYIKAISPELSSADKYG